MVKYACPHCGKDDIKIRATNKRPNHIYRALQCKVCGWRFVVYSDLNNHFISYGSDKKSVVTKRARRIDVSKVPIFLASSMI